MMTKQLRSVLAITIGLLATAMPARAQFVPAPTTGERISMELTDSDITYQIQVEADQPHANSLWADLNGNGNYDAGEELIAGELKPIRFQQTAATVYGTMTGFRFNNPEGELNGMISIDLSNCPGLTSLDCYRNRLSALNLSAVPLLKTLNCRGNDLSELNLSAQTVLTDLICHGNKLSNIDLSANTELLTLDCDYNGITGLDLTANKKLTSLICGGSNLGSIDVTGCTALTHLECTFSSVNMLELATCESLKTLRCFNNQLTELDLSGNPNLTELGCRNNQLTKLDLSANSALVNLSCQNNKLQSLDLSAKPNLITVLCFGNRIGETAMQSIVDGLPTVPTGQGYFVPVNTNGDDNVCTESQVAIATAKNWKVTNPAGQPYPGTTSLATVSADHNIHAWTENGILHLSELPIGASLHIYTVGGALVHTAMTTTRTQAIALPRGAYVLRIGSQSLKAIVR